MSQSLRPPQHRLTVVNPRPHQDGRGVLILGRIRPAGRACPKCAGSGRATVQRDGALVSVACPVCSLSAVDAPEAQVMAR
ncbi:hypothetical protein F7Q99_38965 [Streptomyces kaniharaensis]|uniref:Uncharacterized protein n=1 Tax=Streptomyces kaniharaensis TaxID=212423 RepID=A0A6N7L655_9ACTN|nr:hypothetical protein [Streptomyces kaniharaensis]MQS18014.1 hypothetical protein [Streptomyces kaniharaensis]